MRTIYLMTLLWAFFAVPAWAQQLDESADSVKQVLDSLYIQEVEAEHHERPKVLHAEPLYIDLIRDLGARKGEKEWNVGMGLIDNNHYDTYEALVEYEFAPIDRLGLEIELPFSFYDDQLIREEGAERPERPRSRLNSLKLAAQYTFLVSERHKTSLALGYIHEFEFADFARYGQGGFLQGYVYNPFFVAAKRWGDNFHTLVYTGPVIEHHKGGKLHTHWQINTNLHYMIPGTRNFIGLEFNKEFHDGDFDMVLRPQMRVSLAENLVVGIVTGIPIQRENQRFSSFLRLIYEPGHKHRH